MMLAVIIIVIISQHLVTNFMRTQMCEYPNVRGSTDGQTDRQQE